MSSINIESENNTINSNLLSSKKESLIENQKKDDSENLSEASFSLSKPSDIDSLYENNSNKSNENLKLVYESTLQNAEEDLNQEIDLEFENISKKESGFDPNIKLFSSNFYKGIVDSITGGKQNNDKTNIGITKYGSISAAIDDQTLKLKNDLSGVPVIIGDVTNIDLSEKKKGESNDNDFILKDSKLSKESSSGMNGKKKLDYKKTMSLEYSKERESDKKEMISYSSQNKPFY